MTDQQQRQYEQHSILLIAERAGSAQEISAALTELNQNLLVASTIPEAFKLGVSKDLLSIADWCTIC